MTSYLLFYIGGLILGYIVGKWPKWLDDCFK